MLYGIETRLCWNEKPELLEVSIVTEGATLIVNLTAEETYDLANTLMEQISTSEIGFVGE